MNTKTDQERRGVRAIAITTLRLIFMVVCVGILTLPAVNMVVPLIEQKPLSGVLPDLPCPHASLSSLADEKLQRGFTACFEHRYGARPWATRLDNSLAYWGFGEAPPDKRVRVGTNGVLYVDEHFYYHNRDDQPDTAAIAAKIKRAQDLLRARGKVFVLMVMPTKLTSWPEDVPSAYTREGTSPELSTAHITDPFVAALRAAGVLFVDGRRSIASLPREAVYAKTGRHLTAPGACLIFSDALALARPLVHDAEVPEIECNYRMTRDVSIDEEDFDLFRLLNIWSPAPTDAVPVMNPMTERTPRERRADAMVIGSSFGWKIIHEAERTHALGHIYFHYYQSTLVDRDGKPDRNVVPRSKEWLDLIASSTLIFYPTPEEYLVGDGESFCDSVIASYGDPAGTPPDAVKP